MKNLNIKLVLVATVFSFSSVAAMASTAESQSPLLLAGKNHEQHEKENGDNARSDTAITADVKAKFVKEKLFGDVDISAMSISVETDKGVVHLTGTADNKTQIKNAEKLAKSVEGVKKVVNEVKVKKDDDKDTDDKNKDKENKDKDKDEDHKY